ncbi:hypothetical protein PTSG_04798 [Salpingoeca rosetta]|uniref:Uncharacterized protein n=1 Tax=Salpingoeca rosetta (strain ATCC 50818 / BSB-021) TaxID=946362 RepID=F2U9Q7_SALR5|nr:uncharacterized protein PTSG_04798 [Salpingoeca rosetta]EGD73084.1 hypothetical protein PTSG_04798 [Salpingoeca rosetta]|eukprot:XP_004994115.1 hypothetical protein PTSG_04798 [Salpingoeca rosetta]
MLSYTTSAMSDVFVVLLAGWDDDGAVAVHASEYAGCRMVNVPGLLQAGVLRSDGVGAIARMVRDEVHKAVRSSSKHPCKGVLLYDPALGGAKVRRAFTSAIQKQLAGQPIHPTFIHHSLNTPGAEEQCLWKSIWRHGNAILLALSHNPKVTSVPFDYLKALRRFIRLQAESEDGRSDDGCAEHRTTDMRLFLPTVFQNYAAGPALFLDWDSITEYTPQGDMRLKQNLNQVIRKWLLRARNGRVCIVGPNDGAWNPAVSDSWERHSQDVRDTIASLVSTMQQCVLFFVFCRPNSELADCSFSACAVLFACMHQIDLDHSATLFLTDKQAPNVGLPCPTAKVSACVASPQVITSVRIHNPTRVCSRFVHTRKHIAVDTHPQGSDNDDDDDDGFVDGSVYGGSRHHGNNQHQQSLHARNVIDMQTSQHPQMATRKRQAVVNAKPFLIGYAASSTSGLQLLDAKCRDAIPHARYATAAEAGHRMHTRGSVGGGSSSVDATLSSSDGARDGGGGGSGVGEHVLRSPSAVAHTASRVSSHGNTGNGGNGRMNRRRHDVDDGDDDDDEDDEDDDDVYDDGGFADRRDMAINRSSRRGATRTVTTRTTTTTTAATRAVASTTKAGTGSSSSSSSSRPGARAAPTSSPHRRRLPMSLLDTKPRTSRAMRGDGDDGGDGGGDRRKGKRESGRGTGGGRGRGKKAKKTEKGAGYRLTPATLTDIASRIVGHSLDLSAPALAQMVVDDTADNDDNADDADDDSTRAGVASVAQGDGGDDGQEEGVGEHVVAGSRTTRSRASGAQAPRRSTPTHAPAQASAATAARPALRSATTTRETRGRTTMRARATARPAPPRARGVPSGADEEDEADEEVEDEADEEVEALQEVPETPFASQEQTDTDHHHHHHHHHDDDGGDDDDGDDWGNVGAGDLGTRSGQEERRTYARARDHESGGSGRKPTDKPAAAIQATVHTRAGEASKKEDGDDRDLDLLAMMLE